MKKQQYLFNEDVKKLKQIFIALMILFFIGAITNLIVIIVFSWIIPKDSILHRDMDGITIFITILCWFMTIYLYVYVMRAEKFKYYITITEKEFNVLIKDSLKTFNVIDLVDYEIVKEFPNFSEFKIQFDDVNTIFITTKKTKELKTVLDNLMKINKNST